MLNDVKIHCKAQIKQLAAGRHSKVVPLPPHMMTIDTFIDASYHTDVKISSNKLPTEIALSYPPGSVLKGFETTFRKRFRQSSNSNAHRMECDPVVGEPTNGRSNIPFKPNGSGAGVEEVFFLCHAH